MSDYFPIFLNLSKKPVLMIGGGTVAAHKTKQFLGAEASITLVSPDLNDELSELVYSGVIQWRPRQYQTRDLQDMFMVVAATDDPILNARVFAEGEARHMLVNAVDDPVSCNFILGSVARSGPVQVAVSTSGTSPILAHRIRRQIEDFILKPETGRLANFLGSWRRAVSERLSGFETKKSFWLGVFNTEVPRLASSGKLGEANEKMSYLLSVKQAESRFQQRRGA